MTEKRAERGDWKEQAQREKERLSRELDAEKQAGDSGEGPPLPEADFVGLISALATQAVIAMGAGQDESGQRVAANIEAAKYYIDTLGVLEEKTRGNLTVEEGRALRGVLADLRMRYVLAATGDEAAAADQAGSDGRSDGETGAGGPGRVILPT